MGLFINISTLTGFTHSLCYARLAVKPYDVGLLVDPLISITVCAYDEDDSVAGLQDRLLHTDMQSELDAQYGPGAVDWAALRLRTDAMLSELFRAAGRAIGQWPNSVAYYSVDVIYELDENTADTNVTADDTGAVGEGKLSVQPKLIEVNFMGDWHGVEAAVRNERILYLQWARDLVRTLVFPSEEVPHERVYSL